MAATYRVSMSDELWALRAELTWPAGLHLAETPPADYPDNGWLLVGVHDEHAPADLDGKLVDLVLAKHAGQRPTVLARVPVSSG